MGFQIVPNRFGNNGPLNNDDLFVLLKSIEEKIRLLKTIFFYFSFVSSNLERITTDKRFPTSPANPTPDTQVTFLNEDENISNTYIFRL